MTGFFYQTNDVGEESKTAERQKERQSVRDRAQLEMRDSIGNKIDHQRKYLCQMCEIYQRDDQDAANDVVPMIRIFSLLIYR